MASSWMLRLVIHVSRVNRSVRRLLVTVNVVPSSPCSCRPDDGGDTFLLNFGSYKTHMA
jgi:hypothetical protein